jgi:plastocyanin
MSRRFLAPRLRRHTARLLVSGALVLVGATACAAGEDAPAPAPPPAATPEPADSAPAPTDTEDGTAEAVVTISDFAYDVPDSVAAGSQITVVNEDREAHTFTLRGTDVDLVLQGGQTATVTVPGEAGTYEVVCAFHGSMTSELVVT